MPGAQPMTHENSERRISNFRMLNRAAEEMRLDRLAATMMALVPANPFPFAISEIRHLKLDIHRALDPGGAAMGRGSCRDA
jgi:hypothetical protein